MIIGKILQNQVIFSPQEDYYLLNILLLVQILIIDYILHIVSANESISRSFREQKMSPGDPSTIKTGHSPRTSRIKRPGQGGSSKNTTKTTRSSTDKNNEKVINSR